MINPTVKGQNVTEPTVIFELEVDEGNGEVDLYGSLVGEDRELVATITRDGTLQRFTLLGGENANSEKRLANFLTLDHGYISIAS